ncbi:MAG: transcriptional regulator GcvA [Azospirillum sp.]|nr:transcriptional regulator GcvA [Azospirillum sp.]MCA3265217.1 transcriptional regulator GcvA [Azospirillum sp.]MCZ8123500.1 transcriptional regulator GcvA [Magnetospirillum sp.]
MTPSPLLHLPPISALRAFEAAARLRSFTLAADELGLTQGAISHQVRGLEDQLGFELFRREPRRISTTAKGEQLAQAVREGLGTVARAIVELTKTDAGPHLVVSTLAGFAVKWLFPRLIRFDEKHPRIELSIATTGQLADFSTGEADVAIRYGLGRYPGLHVEKILDEDMFPVCAPKLMRGAKALRKPADLAGVPLLHDDITKLEGHTPGWRLWLSAAGVSGVDPAKGRRFGQSNMSIQAAIEGLGVALGRAPLVADDLAAGRLVRPFDLAVPSGYGYYFVCPPRALERPKVAAFRAWVLAETKLR